MMGNIYSRLHFMVCESNGHSIVNIRYSILDMVNKIRKEKLNESSR
jgi:hypothetical protein